MKRFRTELAIDPIAISQAGEDAHAFLLAAGVDQRAAHHVALVLDEILTNVLLHGGAPDEAAAIQVEIEPDCVRGEIRDAGLPFDPCVEASERPDGELSQREVGGLGLHLVRKLATELGYARDGERNLTRFTIPRGQSPRD